MKWTIFLLIISLYLSCSGSKVGVRIDVDELYAQACCALVKAKQNFRTPELKGDSIQVLDHYFIDTTNLYYNVTNSGFEFQFVNDLESLHSKSAKDDWEKYKIFSSLRNFKGLHQINDECLDQMKIKFISREEIVDQFEEHNTLLYSPLINYKNNFYKIYEHRLTEYEDFYYAYIFRRENNNFEFVKRTYHTDVFMSVKEDYMKTIDFGQGYEEYINSKG